MRTSSFRPIATQTPIIGLSNGLYIDGIDHAGLSKVVVTGFTIKNANFEGILVTNALYVILASHNGYQVPGAGAGAGIFAPARPWEEWREDKGGLGRFIARPKWARIQLSEAGNHSHSKVLPVATPTQAGSLCLCYTNTVAW
jgi:hypothetical protein